MSNKNNTNSTTSSGGIGFFSLLTITFIVLKLCNVISWPWVWVLAPLWISFGIVVLLVLVTIISAIIVKYIKQKKENKKEE